MDKIRQEDIDNIIRAGGDMWEKFSGCRVLVTGAAGLIGSYLVATLLRIPSCKVVALVRDKNKIDHKDLEVIEQDVCEPILIDGNVDYIIHAASQASPKYIANDPVGTMLPNIIGTNNLLSLARRSKSKGFLLVSGGEVYGTGQLNTPTKESGYGALDPMAVRSCYAESKRAGEALCACYKAQYGINTIVARLAHTYGPGVKRDDGRVFADFVYNIIDGKNIQLNSDGSAIRSFCYISDAILGLFTVLLKGESGRAYNVCNENACSSIFNLAVMLADIYHIGVKVLSDRKDPLSKSCLDSSEARALGWNPQIPIAEGFTRTISSIRDNI